MCWTWYNQSNWVLPAVTPLLALGSGSFTGLIYDFVLERLDRARTRRTLERYVSRDVVKDLLDNPQTFLNSLGGVRKQVTILFSDVRGFTTLTEGADAALLVKQLNEYFNEMVRIVFNHGGTLDKFIGDAVMADWGGIVSDGPARDAQNAVATSLAMKRSLARLNEGWRARQIQPLAFGIGINHGSAIFGNLGCDQKMEVSVIGDAVNLASRLEGLTKEYHLDLLLGETMAPLVRETFWLRTVDCVQVKGKTKPVDVFTVVGERAEGEPEPEWLGRYEEGIRLYRARQFGEAERAFADAIRRQASGSLSKLLVPSDAPEDFLCAEYIKRCRDLLAYPPGPEWNGVFVMTRK